MSKKLRADVKQVVRFVNGSDISDLVEFLDDNNISYDPDLADGSYPRFVSFGTSKKFTVGTSKYFDIYQKKGFTSGYYYFDSMNPSLPSLSDFLVATFEDIIDTPIILDEVSMNDDEDDDNFPSDDIIIALYEKVKKQKKSPKNYVIVLVEGTTDNYKATTNTTLSNFGNLSDLFERID